MTFHDRRYAGTKNPYRKFAECIFCENPANSKEHILSKWIAKKLGLQHNAVSDVLRMDATGALKLEKVKAPSPVTGFTSQSVCEDCNNGWMSRAVDAAKPLMDLLIDGKFRGEIDHIAQEKLYRALAIMGFIVDVETTQSPPVFSDAFREHFRTHEGLYSEIRISIGRLAYFASNPPFNIAHMNVRSGFGNLIACHSKRIGTAVGNLAIAIDLGRPLRKNIPPGFRRLHQGAPILWPHPFLITSKRLRKLAHLDRNGELLLRPIR